MLADKRSILQCLGNLIIKPELLDDYNFETEDFEVEPFYEIIFSCIYNLYQQGIGKIDGFAIDSFLSSYQRQYKIFEDNHGLDYCNQAVEICEQNNFLYYYHRLKKFSCLRFLAKQGYDTKRIYDHTVVEPAAQEREMQKLDQLSLDDIVDFISSTLVEEVRSKYSSESSSRGQLAGEGMKELIASYKQTPEYGIPLQSGVLTTVARGARLGKLYMRSASSGGGKTRTAMADICGFSIPWFYDTEKEEWVYTNFSEPSLFISTELDEEELQTLILAYISGVEESHILDGTYEDNEEERVLQAADYIASSPLYIEIINDFGIQDIVNIIKKYKREKGCNYFVFDYVHMSAKLIAEVSSMSKGMKMREDQVLFLFIDTLKNLCNSKKIFVLTMSQLNGTYKDSVVKDETMLRGAKNMADRLDLGEISLPPTKGELEGIEHILKHQIKMPRPNLVRNLYKVRRGKLTRIKIWQYVNLGTCRTQDLFVTDNDFNLIPIDITEIQAENSKEVEKIIEKHSVDSKEIEPTDLEEQAEVMQQLFDW